MVEREYGKIVNFTSIHTKNGVGMSPAYDVAKYSLLGLTKSLALELGREGVRVNAVAPGWANTRLTEEFSQAVTEQILDNNPLGRFAEPEEVAQAVAFLVLAGKRLRQRSRTTRRRRASAHRRIGGWTVGKGRPYRRKDINTITEYLWALRPIMSGQTSDWSETATVRHSARSD